MLNKIVKGVLNRVQRRQMVKMGDFVIIKVSNTECEEQVMDKFFKSESDAKASLKNMYNNSIKGLESASGAKMVNGELVTANAIFKASLSDKEYEIEMINMYDLSSKKCKALIITVETLMDLMEDKVSFKY